MVGVRAIVFDIGGVLERVDDHVGHVEAARRRGWQAVLHRDTSASIRDVCALLGR